MRATIDCVHCYLKQAVTCMNIAGIDEDVGFSRNDYSRFTEKLEQADEVVIVGDNAGEIVFDKLLVEELSGMGKTVTYIVKGGPVLNDATVEDAVQVGMDKIARVITTGSNYLIVSFTFHRPAGKRKTWLLLPVCWSL
ncbi:DUF89 family protein [Desulfallas sp. Bu1-1]|uniref:ARMT1-like domain-containing protein n=1 Tax=Desulfallas sp. Bu1-1 TaxID=2787620 RepID=UPI00189D3884|nr:ARMT1-like domain-containing protein [Desulfallas sp. Bu1-1]MBF7081737.1 DUF89 family protein [Desulfallas sp. Bu1-1]